MLAAGFLVSPPGSLFSGPSCVPLLSVQDYFVRTENQRKGMLASTHLVLRTPEGTKYQAAQKWGLPAVTMRWVLEATRRGRRPDESRFFVDLPPSPGQVQGNDGVSLAFLHEFSAVCLFMVCS